MSLPLLLFHNQGRGQPIGGRESYIQKVQSIQKANLILYHPMNEPSGVVANDYSPENNDGAYTGVTLGQPGIGDGETCPLFDGANDFNNIYTTGFRDDFSGDEGTFAIWAKVSGAGVWTDGTLRRNGHLERNANNYIYISRHTINNRLRLVYTASATVHTSNIDGISTLEWMHLAITWSAADDETKIYYNGTQNGATKTGLGAWVGVLDATQSNIGARATTPSNLWDGWLAHGAVWTTSLSAAEILSLATV